MRNLLYMAFQSALESSKNMGSAINMTSMEQLIVCTHSLNVTAEICMCVERKDKETVILVIFVVTFHAKENTVTSNLKGRNHVSTYLDVTEISVWCTWFWS